MSKKTSQNQKKFWRPAIYRPWKKCLVVIIRHWSGNPTLNCRVLMPNFKMRGRVFEDENAWSMKFLLSSSLLSCSSPFFPPYCFFFVPELPSLSRPSVHSPIMFSQASYSSSFLHSLIPSLPNPSLRVPPPRAPCITSSHHRKRLCAQQHKFVSWLLNVASCGSTFYDQIFINFGR